MQAISPIDDDMSRLERVARSRVALWVALAMSLIGLLAFVMLFNMVLPSAGENLSNAARIGLGLVLSLVPAGLWLGFFYRLDRLEPEPKQMVLSVFVLGVLATAALHQPVLQGFFEIDSWLHDRWWTYLLGSILVVGFFEQFLIYLTVRYSVFDNAEFDQRVDGIIYSMAAGLGLATVLNFIYVLARGGVDLDIGSIRMVVNALAFASFAGVQGYFIGQTRFERTPVYYLPLGLTLAALLNGLFFFILERTAGGGFDYNPWRDLILAAVVAVITLLIVFWLVGRANEETLRVARQGVPAETEAAMVPPLSEEPTAVASVAPASTTSPRDEESAP